MKSLTCTLTCTLCVLIAFGLFGNVGAAEPKGKSLYRQRCDICHQERGFGTAILARRVGAARSLLEKRADLNPNYIRLAVRQGIGSMPRFTKVELTEDELQAIIQYLNEQSSK